VLLVLVALVPAGFFALAWQSRVRAVTRETTALVHFLARRGLREQLLARRHAIAMELERLATRVPRAVLDGEAT
jgi:hypothetical protein